MDSYFIWDVSRIITTFSLFGFNLPIRWYGLLFASGIIGAYLIIRAMFIAEKKSMQACEMLPIVVVISTVIGARLGHVFLYHPLDYLSNPMQIFKMWEGGLASHGGFLFVILSLVWLSRKFAHSEISSLQRTGEIQKIYDQTLKPVYGGTVDAQVFLDVKPK